MHSHVFAAAVLLICGSASARQPTSSSAYHVGTLTLVSSQVAPDWQGHYTSASGSVDVYCNSSSGATNCSDSPPGGGWYEVELEGERDTKHIRHTLMPVAVFVEGKQMKLHPDFLGRIDEDYDPLA